MPQVKVTNITHNNPEKPGKGFGCWFMDKFIQPGDSIIIDIGNLPTNWRQLTNIFRYEEILEPLFHRQEDPGHTALLEQLLIQQANMMQAMTAMQAKLAEQPTPQIIVTSGSGVTSLPKALGPGLPTLSQEVFVGDIAQVQNSEIQIEAVEQKSEKVEELKAKMAKLKGKKPKQG